MLDLLIKQGEQGHAWISPVVLRDAKSLRRDVDAASGETLSKLVLRLRDTFVTEVEENLFFVVPAARKDAYLDPGKWFGEAAVDKFPSIARDVRDAFQCYAFGQWTATVFHAMRILEHGLRYLAKQYGLKGPEDDSWGTILGQIEKKIKDLEQQPKISPIRRRRLQADNEAAAQLGYAKNAWRNRVSHADASYDEQGATEVLDCVRAFMRVLAVPRRRKS
jgi:hypothetical protein